MKFENTTCLNSEKSQYINMEETWFDLPGILSNFRANKS